MSEWIEFDKQLFLYLNNLGSAPFDDFWLFITSKFSWIPLYLFLLYLLFQLKGIKHTLIILVIIGIMITITDQFSYTVKHAVMRLRPCGDPSLYGLGRFVAECGSYGYFSGHATSSFALAIFLGKMFRDRYKIMIYLLILWAFLVSYSRIYLGVHFPADIITGGIVGVVIAILCLFIYRIAKKRFVDKVPKKDN